MPADTVSTFWVRPTTDKELQSLVLGCTMLNVERKPLFKSDVYSVLNVYAIFSFRISKMVKSNTCQIRQGGGEGRDLRENHKLVIIEQFQLCLRRKKIDLFNKH